MNFVFVALPFAMGFPSQRTHLHFGHPSNTPLSGGLGDHNGHKYCLCCCPCISCIYCIYCLFCCFCCFCCFSSVLHSTSCSWCPGCCIFPWPFERLGFSQVFPGICSTPGKIFCTSHSLLQGCHNGIQQAQLCQLFQPVPPHSVLRLYFFF